MACIDHKLITIWRSKLSMHKQNFRYWNPILQNIQITSLWKNQIPSVVNSLGCLAGWSGKASSMLIGCRKEFRTSPKSAILRRREEFTASPISVSADEEDELEEEESDDNRSTCSVHDICLFIVYSPAEGEHSLTEQRRDDNKQQEVKLKYSEFRLQPQLYGLRQRQTPGGWWRSEVESGGGEFFLGLSMTGFLTCGNG